MTGAGIRGDGESSLGRDRQETPETLVVRARSYRWKAAAVLLIVAGWVASSAVASAILQSTAPRRTFTTLPRKMPWGSRPYGRYRRYGRGRRGCRAVVATASGAGDRPGRHHLSAPPGRDPWTMIADVPDPETGGSPDGRGRGIVLTDGRELKVRGLDKLARLAAQRQDLPAPAAPAASAGSWLRSWLPFPLPAAWPVPAYPQARQLRKRRADQLPGPALQDRVSVAAIRLDPAGAAVLRLAGHVPCRKRRRAVRRRRGRRARGGPCVRSSRRIGDLVLLGDADPYRGGRPWLAGLAAAAHQAVADAATG
jgi:hypothetical protein